MVSFGLHMIYEQRPCLLSDSPIVLHSPDSGWTKSFLWHHFDFSYSQTFSASFYFAYQVTSKLFPSSFDLCAVSSLPPSILILYLCPAGLPAILLVRLEFSHSVACLLSFPQFAMFSSQSLLVINFKISGKVSSLWQFTPQAILSLLIFYGAKKEKLSYCSSAQWLLRHIDDTSLFSSFFHRLFILSFIGTLLCTCQGNVLGTEDTFFLTLSMMLRYIIHSSWQTKSQGKRQR